MANMNEIKDRIKRELSFTVNIGISDSKLLAKMASDFEKPDKDHQRDVSDLLLKTEKGACQLGSDAAVFR